ncbi:helix-turn-helix domain-containing protein [Streptomyces mirabilis]|uniref:helix-turn-helix domain-containing protein n=2 Tax=Streptomyces mirabilis TaxID=68239 RepID=UPI00332BC0A2
MRARTGRRRPFERQQDSARFSVKNVTGDEQSTRLNFWRLSASWRESPQNWRDGMGFSVLGLAEETERVYVALVRQPRCSSAELAEACGMSAITVGRQLSNLLKDGLAVRDAGRPPRFTATPPDVAVTALIDQREDQLKEARSLVQQLTETHREAARISQPDMAVELLTNREHISDAVRRLTTYARHEVRAFDCPPYVDRPGSNLGHQLQQQRRGVIHRVIYDREAVAWPGRLHNDIVPSIRAGEQARVHPELPLKLVISDGRTAILPFTLAPGGQSVAYLIHQSPLLVALESLFEAQWERALPLSDTRLPPGGSATAAESEDAQPDEDTRALLALLASGLTDAAIARAQGWSERTTQRRIHQLMRRLGASTRFQTSLTAARRGWL